MRESAFALVVGCDRFDSFAPLRGAEDDAVRVRDFLIDPNRGAFNASNVRLLRSPSIEEVKRALSETSASAAKHPGGLCLWYVASHGLVTGREGVQIIFRDSEQSNLTFSALSLRQIAQLFAEHRPSASITILDLCHAGAHGAAAAELALNEIWREQAPLADGHFVLAACAANETAGENLGGGRFTQALLEKVTSIGKERPYEAEILVSELAAALTVHTDSRSRQTPVWTGIAVSKPVALSVNPYFDANAPRPPAALSKESIPEADRGSLLELGRLFTSPMVRVGTGQNWCREACAVLLSIPGAPCSEAGQRLAVGRLVTNACERASSFSSERDEDQLIDVLAAGTVALGAVGGLDVDDIRNIAYELSKLAETTIARLAARLEKGAWSDASDGPAAIALAPIRFWSALGRAALIGLGCRLIGLADLERRVSQSIVDLVSAHPALYRIEWAGQYPDLSAVLGYVARQNRELARRVATALFDRAMSDEKEGHVPAAASLTAERLGRQLSAKYSPVRVRAAADVAADEMLPLVMLMLWTCEESPVAVDMKTASLERTGSASICLYDPESVRTTFSRTMSKCTVREWVRSSAKSLAQMIQDFKAIRRGPLSTDPARERAEAFATYAAGRLFRNRSSFWVFSSLASAAPL